MMTPLPLPLDKDPKESEGQRKDNPRGKRHNRRAERRGERGGTPPKVALSPKEEEEEEDSRGSKAVRDSTKYDTKQD